MNKKSIIIVLSIFIALILFVAIDSYIHNNTFVEKNMEDYTGVELYIVKVKYYDSHQSYIEVLLSERDKDELIKKFKFEDTFEMLRGKIGPDFISENENYKYHIIKRGERSYRYVLIALEITGNTLIVYEMYGS
jgi:hypothetical protein